ncbi:MAG: hypothetical protein MI757_16245 [Pirellulales bacterium]|nr:hypothetical protein [Pirellulales bacterium]
MPWSARCDCGGHWRNYYASFSQNGDPMHKTLLHKAQILFAIATIPVIGCSDGERVAEVATEAAQQQARQNEEMAQLNREVAEVTKRLVEANALAREEIAAMQRDVQTEHARVSQQRDQLETERKEIAAQRRTESMLGPILKGCSVAALAVSTIGFCWYLLFGLRHHGQTEEVLNELLVEEIVSDRPAILPMASTAIDRVALPTDDRTQEQLPQPN